MQRSCSSEEKKPSGAGKEKCETIRAPGNVIDRRAMHRMHNPEQRNQKCCVRYRRRKWSIFLRCATHKKRSDQLSKQKEQQYSASNVQEHIGEMRSEEHTSELQS